MSTQERIRSLHERMDALTAARERRKTAALGAGSVMLTLCLIMLVFSGEGMHFNGAGGSYSGTSLLLEGAGGYVLAAVAAFFAGVVITIVLRRRHDRDVEEGHNSRNV
ncbi:MAG: hypothetical protein IIZ17_06590 [Eubacteriaceae bacterium]|nr:hypothetical protein [Eubacteriaceae bacterium]